MAVEIFTVIVNYGYDGDSITILSNREEAIAYFHQRVKDVYSKCTVTCRGPLNLPGSAHDGPIILEKHVDPFKRRELEKKIAALQSELDDLDD